ncbi:oxaloacetate decarboxylase alpha subunit [Altererythrobacter atlanticus]|uniref:2-oxoglutarate carboxylase large subunit n=1 Tax=Croceibacterium atlanticum TaxID=1267766 RepID=A0A0F7KV52_9SPHN|nr:acetyl-CoA carboxylase [Croceibacterium atlanticum]AKH44223.1 2-oxoglutarate carboxylase large subunit [Croceibacterium atlanticum]MBB5732534.1 oxaloacetate decarboxylase alpha subunit [Croceibacterium atlanticum]
MANIELVETSLRDGNQCLWGALGVTTANTLAVAPALERCGFKAIDFTTSTHMGVAVRYKQEDPWERIRLMAEACPTTPLQFLSTGFRFIAWETATPEFMELAFRTLARNGIRRFALADPMNDAQSNVEVARMVKRAGGEQVVGALVYTISPIHDDAHYAEAARIMAESPDVDALYIKDPGGLLTSRRARTLIPAILEQIGDKKLELHAHCTIGLAEQAYLEGADLGVTAVQCASGGAADGTSNPPIERMIANLREMGHTVEIDDEAVAEVAQYFRDMAEAEGLPTGSPMAFDAAYLHHQLPGGMVGTMRRHLADHRVSHLEGAVIEELGRVREELGWPIVMTPFAQMLQTQAVMNVTGDERYGVIPDEIIRYALGKFGRPNVPIEPDVMDKIMANPRTKELEAEKGMADLDDLRKRIGPNLSDEEFLLRATMPANLVDAMQAAGPAQREYNPQKQPVMELLRQMLARTDLTRVSVEKAGFKLELERNEP